MCENITFPAFVDIRDGMAYLKFSGLNKGSAAGRGSTGFVVKPGDSDIFHK